MSKSTIMKNIVKRIVRIILCVFAFLIGVLHLLRLINYDWLSAELGYSKLGSLITLSVAFLFAFIVWPPKKFLNETKKEESK